jgi:tetratricopeptide (TPR) repeat protein
MRRLLLIALLALSASAAFATAEDVGSLIQQGDAYDEQLDTQRALASYLQAEKLGSNDPNLYVRIARQYAFSMNDTRVESEQRDLGEKALSYAKRAVETDPKSAKAQLSVAICYGRLAGVSGNRTKVEYSRFVKEYADKALALDSSDSYAYHVLGAWNYELAGIGSFTRTIAKMIYGDIPPASYENAERYFRRAAAMAPQRVAHHVELGRTYIAEGKKDLAEAELRQALTLPSKEKDDPESKRRAVEALKKLREG